MEDLNKIFNYQWKLYITEEEKQEIFKNIDLEAKILKEELKIFQSQK